MTPPGGLAVPSSRAEEGNNVGNFLSFRTMWTPVLIQWAFVVGAGLLVVGGALTALSGLATATPGRAMVGLASAVVGPILLRIWCEVLVVVFKIHEAVEELVEQGRRS
jgi:hypothetical protein